MKILNISELTIPEIKVIKFAKYNDDRGYFSETLNHQVVKTECPFLSGFTFKQTNESFSYANTLRGLHIQTNMGKLVRLVYGKMIDFALDLRDESPTYKHIVAYELHSTNSISEWIWLPPGFAHGVWLIEDSLIEYYCTTLYNPSQEFTYPFFSPDINWSLCDTKIKDMLTALDMNTIRIKDSDLVSTFPDK